MAEIMVPTTQSKRRKRRWGMIFIWLLFCGLFTAQAAYTILYTPNVQLLPAKETNADGSQVNPLDIVMLADTSGATKFIGQDMASGFQDAIAAAKITDDIRLVVRDTEGEVAKTSAVASGSASGFRTLALFGPTEQTGFESVRDAATEGLVVAITPVGSSSSAPNGGWTFSLQGPTRQSGFKLGRVLQRLGTGPLVAHLIKEGSEGSQFWDGVLGAFADVTYSPDVRSTPQMEVQWPFKSRSGSSDTISPDTLASDAIIISLPAADAEAALRELRDNGYRGIIVLSGEGSLANFPNRFTGDPKEALEEGYFTNGALSLVPFTPSIGNAESQRLINDYRATHKADPSWAYAYGHDAGQLIAEFVASAKADGSFSLSNPGNTQQALQKFLKSSSTRTTKLHGYTGDLEFSSRNDRDLSPKIVVYQAGKQRPFYLQVGDQPHLKSQVKTGNETIQVGSEVFNVTPVVYTGINMRNLTNLDFDKGSFDASFDLWLKASETIDFKYLTFINAVADPKLVESQDTTTPQGWHYQHFLVQGSFRFIAQPADLLLDRASVSISLRHSRLDGRQFAFVIDPDAIDTVARRTRDSNFRVESSLIGVAVSKQNALGDPRAIHGEIAFSVLRYEAELRRAKSTLTSRLVELLGQEIVQLTFIGLLAAILLFTFMWIIYVGLGLQIIISVIFIFLLFFSQAALFTLPVAYSFSVTLIEQIVMTYDFLLVFAVVRLIDLIVFSFLRRTGAVVEVQPVILFILRSAIYLGGVSYFYVTILNRDLLPVLATASVLLTVVGLALRELIFDAVAGIAISTDDTFTVGNWVNLRARDRNITGVITSVGWRSVRVRSRDLHVHDVPNSVVATQILSHLSLSSTRVEVPFVMSAKVEAETALSSIRSALDAALENVEGIDNTRPIRVIIDGLEDDRMRCTVQVHYAAALSTDTLRTLVLNVVRKELEKARAMSQTIFLGQLRTL